MYTVSKKTRIPTIQLYKFTTFTNYFWYKDTLFNSHLATVKDLKLA